MSGVKDYCVVCASIIGVDEERYEEKGNYCQPCVNKANENIDKKRVDNLLLKDESEYTKHITHQF